MRIHSKTIIHNFQTLILIPQPIDGHSSQEHRISMILKFLGDKFQPRDSFLRPIDLQTSNSTQIQSLVAFRLKIKILFEQLNSCFEITFIVISISSVLQEVFRCRWRWLFLLVFQRFWMFGRLQHQGFVFTMDFEIHIESTYYYYYLFIYQGRGPSFCSSESNYHTREYSLWKKSKKK